jgi:hypothetical protein
VFIFNPALLLIGIDHWWEGALSITTSILAVLVLSAAMMNWFVTRSRLWESAVLVLACFTLLRPDWWIDQFYPKFVERPAQEFMTRVAEAPANKRLSFVVSGYNIKGDEITKTVNIPLGPVEPAAQRLRNIGLSVTALGDRVSITNVQFGSYAKRIGLEVGYDIVAVLEPADRPSHIWPIGAGFILVGVVALIQRSRLVRAPQPQPA